MTARMRTVVLRLALVVGGIVVATAMVALSYWLLSALAP
jgi:hypothetical protein